MPVSSIGYRENRDARVNAPLQMEFDAVNDVRAERSGFDHSQCSIWHRVGPKSVNHAGISVVASGWNEPEFRMTHAPAKNVQDRRDQNDIGSGDASLRPE